MRCWTAKNNSKNFLRQREIYISNYINKYSRQGQEFHADPQHQIFQGDLEVQQVQFYQQVLLLQPLPVNTQSNKVMFFQVFKGRFIPMFAFFSIMSANPIPYEWSELYLFVVVFYFDIFFCKTLKKNWFQYEAFHQSKHCVITNKISATTATFQNIFKASVLYWPVIQNITDVLFYCISLHMLQQLQATHWTEKPLR